jgi:hypothetical protein
MLRNFLIGPNRWHSGLVLLYYHEINSSTSIGTAFLVSTAKSKKLLSLSLNITSKRYGLQFLIYTLH